MKQICDAPLKKLIKLSECLAHELVPSSLSCATTCAIDDQYLVIEPKSKFIGRHTTFIQAFSATATNVLTLNLFFQQ